MLLSFPFRISCHLLVALSITCLSINRGQAQVRPVRGGIGGPTSGAGVMPWAGFGQAGPGLVNLAGPAPAAGGVGGPASGAGVLPGGGFGRPGIGR
ncbi:MAG: hypothetical protein VKO19_00215 [Cyanobacteriota bacterium]|nr:hypothetical protein [Cyanobacteriota bacterium]